MKLQINGNTATTVVGMGTLVSQMLVLIGSISPSTAVEVSAIIASIAMILYKGDKVQ